MSRFIFTIVFYFHHLIFTSAADWLRERSSTWRILILYFKDPALKAGLRKTMAVLRNDLWSNEFKTSSLNCHASKFSYWEMSADNPGPDLGFPRIIFRNNPTIFFQVCMRDKLSLGNNLAMPFFLVRYT